MDVLIVGAGIAGLACADALQSAGMTVKLLDKGRGPGGRMSTRRVTTALGEASFDHGAQYFTVRDPDFARCVEQWRAKGVAARWPAAGDDAWVGAPAMSAPVKELAKSLSVTWTSQVDGIEREDGRWRVGERRYDAAVIATPAEQAAPLLRPWDAGFADQAAATRSAPCWTVMAAFAARVPLESDVLREEGILGWAARNSAKPGRSGPESWVLQAGPGWSAAHLEQTPDTIVAPLLAAFAGRVGGALPELLSATAHRWRYARCGSAGVGFFWNETVRLGACGDWLIGPRVEAAWLSGRRLAAAVLGA